MRLDESACSRFEERYEKVDRVESIEGKCWEWTHNKHSYGYGRISVKGNWRLAHRVSWVKYNSAIPEDKQVNHRCHNESCVNPEHLYLGTQEDNVHDAVEEGNFKDRENGDTHGEINGQSKLSEDDVRQIKKEYENTEKTYFQLADSFGISYAQVGRIVRGERWSHID